MISLLRNPTTRLLLTGLLFLPPTVAIRIFLISLLPLVFFIQRFHLGAAAVAAPAAGAAATTEAAAAPAEEEEIDITLE